MYTNIREELEREYKGYMESHAKYIGESENSLKNHSTETRWKQYQEGKITKGDCINYAIQRNNKSLQKRLEKKLEELENIAKAEDVESVIINVTWKRNPTWGYNPTAEVYVYTTNKVYKPVGKASGCGYDKETAAIGSALNEVAPIIKMLCDVKEKALENGVNPPCNAPNSNREYIAYGAGYGAIPYFEGGVGMSSFESVFNACNFELRHQNHTKTTDYYYFTRKEQ